MRKLSIDHEDVVFWFIAICVLIMVPTCGSDGCGPSILGAVVEAVK